jgi:hypothetical protein
MINFVSVSTSAARYQELSLNPQKLAGQCGKLKCCLNYELDCYLDAQKDFPNPEIPLELMEGTAYHQKTDIFKRLLWYSFDSRSGINTVPVSVERVREIQEMNKEGVKPDVLVDGTTVIAGSEPSFDNVIGEESLTRFEKRSRKKKKSKRKRKHKPQNND